MSVVSYTQKISGKDKADSIRFVRAKEEGKPCWFYLRVSPEKWLEYEQKMRFGDLNVRDYGQILESDWGDYPPEDVIGFMKDEYNFDTPTDSTA